MAKWYRFSISLATKCRIGFAIAVLIIIAAGLFIPYRWMDKLVEQGKYELAHTEVKNVLQRHFRAISELTSSSQPPPLVLPDKISPSAPITQWVDLTSMDTGNMDKPLSRYLWEKFPDDSFLRKAILSFTDEPGSEDEILSLVARNPSPRRTDKNPRADEKKQVAENENPARYVKAIRARGSCLVQGCHTTRLSVTTHSRKIKSANTAPSFSEGQLVGVISVIIPAGQTRITLLFNRIFIIVGGLISCICAVVTFYLITQRIILEPVRSLRTAADKIAIQMPVSAETRDIAESTWQQALDITAEIKTGDEYENLAQAFHQMLTRLKLSQESLRQSNRALDLRLGELEAKNVALFEANKLKSEFLANVSHELRTPLNAIIGFAEILLEQAQDRHDLKTIRYLNNILQSGRGLLKIINELLDLATIEAGKLQVHWEKCSLGDLADSLISFTRPLSENKELKIELLIPHDLPLIDTDPAKLQQILFNLLDNAIKFTPQGGAITISACLGQESDSSPIPRQTHHTYTEANAEPRCLYVTIADTGPGIAPEDRDKIFDKFRQLDGSVTRQYSGTGLGLSIVKELCGILGISISVDDNIPAGTKFILKIPLNCPKSKLGCTEEVEVNPSSRHLSSG